ncbi:cytoplasmic protein [Priestia taiwanensis]|uniref:Cytoplasmic protein n=1 Tax=Priestia taiwanensis TaxID=1347902 RepID=A0A917AYR7_9BACI|nr:cytoplasmic protein [Priestia taiwanensis]MBM7365261.1 hypothetical protein [Priestia taiwanensis]GGE85710.1 hypothetical protein GCM10007140_38870 [Priestia taiwanensis]
MDTQLDKAHRFSSHHRNELEKDTLCGCFYCLNIYSPREIKEWCDNEKTAICPHCGIDSVIGESSGLPITELFLKEMHKVWF